MFTPTALSIILNTFPPPGISAPADFTPHATEIRLAAASDAVEVTAYDSSDTVIAVLRQWVDPSGAVHAAADFDDGFWEWNQATGEVQSACTCLPLIDDDAKHHACP